MSSISTVYIVFLLNGTDDSYSEEVLKLFRNLADAEKYRDKVINDLNILGKNMDGDNSNCFRGAVKSSYEGITIDTFGAWCEIRGPYTILE